MVHRVGGHQSQEVTQLLATQWSLCAATYQSSGLQRNEAAEPWVTVGTAVVMSRLFAAAAVHFKHSTDYNSVHFLIASAVGEKCINRMQKQEKQNQPEKKNNQANKNVKVN